jgi:tRNA (cmo5U34)-methyltransferase
MELLVGDGIVMDKSMWNFKGNVVDKFEAHIKKSVPFYSEGQDLVVKLSDYFTQEDSICYEIGCSTGVLSNKLATHLVKRKCNIIGIDVEGDMIEHAKKTYLSANCNFVCTDILDFSFERNYYTVAYYVLQFVNLANRHLAIRAIYDALFSGGAFCMFEKVRASDAQYQDITKDLYWDYKLENGFSCEEIISKSMSLRGVLEPNTSKENMEMLYNAGFKKLHPLFKYLCFEGILAIK